MYIPQTPADFLLVSRMFVYIISVEGAADVCRKLRSNFITCVGMSNMKLLTLLHKYYFQKMQDCIY